MKNSHNLLTTKSLFFFNQPNMAVVFDRQRQAKEDLQSVDT